MHSISLRELFLQFKNQILFEHFNLDISANKITCLLGKSGVGKSTLLRFIANLIEPSEQTVFRGEIIAGEVAYLAQMDSLLPWLTAWKNVLLGARLRGETFNEAASDKLFKQMGLSADKHKYPHELSGGMRQRVALIRTLLENKPIILMDEPFSALDAITRFQLQNLAVEFFRDKTVLLVTHDPMEALRIADEIIVLDGEPANVKMRLQLTSLVPRSLANDEVIGYQEKLYEALSAS